MQNKKLLTMLLVAMLVVTCAFGMLIVGVQAEERTAVTWTVGSEVESVADALADAAAAEWTASDALIIDMNGGSEEISVDADGILFGLSTIFDASGARLPITIRNGTLTFPEGFEGDVVCANSYTFKNLTFPIADLAVNFYAGSGEVVLDNTALSSQELPTIDNSAKGNLYADCPTAAAFKGWAAPAEGELIPVSLHLKNVNYKYGKALKPGANVGAVNDEDGFEAENVSASDLSVSLIFTDSNVQEVWLRDTEALSPVAELNFIVNDTSTNNSKMRIGRISGVGRSWDSNVKVTYPDYDCNITINGGVVDWASAFHRAASWKGDFNITINGGVFKNEMTVAYGDSSGVVDGVSTLTVNGGTFESNLFGIDTSGKASSNNIYGGTIKKFMGTRIGNDVVNNVYGGKITTYCGHYDTKNGGGDTYVYNNIYGGEIGTYYGTGGTYSDDSGNYTIREVVNNMFGGKITGSFFGSGRQKAIYYVENNLSGTEFMGNFCGTANKADTTMKLYAVCNTMTASKIHGNYNGGFSTMESSNKHTDADGTYNLKNKILGGEVVGRFRGNSDASCFGNVINIIRGGEFNTSTDYAARDYGFYAVGNRAGQGVVTTVSGGNFYKSFVGASANENTAFSTVTLTGGTFGIYNNKAVFVDEFGNPSYEEIVFDADGTITSRESASATSITIGNTTYGLPVAKGDANYEAIQAAATPYAQAYAIYGAEAIKADGTVTLDVIGGTYGTICGSTGTSRTLASVTVNVTDATVANLIGTNGAAKSTVVNVRGNSKITVLTGLSGGGGTHTVESETVKNKVNLNIYSGEVGDVYSNTASVTADVTITATSAEIFDRDDLINHLAEMTKVKRFNGVSAHDLALTGNLIYEITGVHLNAGDSNSQLSNGDVKGNISASYKNCYLDSRFFDFWGDTKIGYAKASGDVDVLFKDCVLNRLNQYINRSSCVGGTYTLVLDSVKLTGVANLKPMNGATTASHVYICGDTVLEGASNYIAIHRQHGKANGYIGVKPGENGELVPVETTVSGAGFICVRYDKGTATTAVGKLDIYESTFDGTSVKYHNSADNTDTADVTTIKGNITLLNGAKIYADKVAPANGEMVTITSDTWAEGEAYVTLSNAGENAKLRGQIIGFSAAYPARVGNNLEGAAFQGLPSASMAVKERIYINLWIPKADLDAYFANDVINTKGESAFDIQVLLDKDLLNEKIYTLCMDTITPDQLAALQVGDYYKVNLGAVGANDFDKEITFEGSAFSASATILDICENGLDGDFDDDTMNLFKALYNYGASVCIDPETGDYYEMKDLGDDFVEDNASDVSISLGATDQISFYQINLLMGDAVGVRFTGTVIDSDAEITMTVDGQLSDAFYVQKKGDKVSVEFYVSAEDFADLINVVVLTDGTPALGASLSIDGYVEQVMDMGTFGGAELALAQLVQACLNLAA